MAGGRPSKYGKVDLKELYRLCLLGLTDDELSKFYEVNRSTITEWKKKHDEFSATLKKGKHIADSKVAASLYKRAKGFTKTVSKTFQSDNGPIEVDVETYYPPDPVSMIYWLKNRQSDKWKDKHEETGSTEERKTNTVTLPDGTKIEL